MNRSFRCSFLAAACVLNGAAYGEGFAVCHAGGRVQKCSDTPILCEMLLEWLRFPASAASAPAPVLLADPT